MNPELRTRLIAGLKDGSIVPCLGPGVLADVVSTATGAALPATSEQLILAMNGGKPMSPKLMYEFSRAAMNVELKRGRTAVTRFLDSTYGATHWTRAALHDWLRAIRPPYVIDINRDTQLLDSYAGVPHTLILGCARIVPQINREGINCVGTSVVCRHVSEINFAHISRAFPDSAPRSCKADEPTWGMHTFGAHVW